ncbi:related to Monocarboxylate transporter [Ustilago sp. UG-2017b]|nr:related to Monocarboxylate transporter [Ustilago sp. UG-2017b]
MSPTSDTDPAGHGPSSSPASTAPTQHHADAMSEKAVETSSHPYTQSHPDILSTDNEKAPHTALSQHEDDTDVEASMFKAGMTSKTEHDLGQAVLKAQGEDAQIFFPEGGFKAWLCVFGGWWCTFITFGYLNAYGIFQDYYQQTTLSHKTQSQISWIGAFQYFLMFAPAVVAGRLFDLGLFRPLFAVGCVLLVFSQMMLSLCTDYYQLFLAQGLGLGLGFGLVFNLAINCPAHYFNRRRGLALGLVASGSSTGGIVFPILVRRLIPMVGYGWTMRVVGFFALFATTLAWFSLSTRLSPSIDVRDKSKGGWKQVQWFQFSAFRNPAYTFFVIGASLLMFGLYFPLSYMDVWSSTNNVPANGYYLPILNAASSFGRILPGLVADKLGRINTILPHLAVSGILIFIFPLCTSLAGLVTFAILYGFTSGCYVSLIPACSSQLGSTSTVGTRNGMMFFLMSFGGLFGLPIAGAILGDLTNPNWWGTAAYCGVMVVLGTCSIAAAKWFATGSIKGKI